jgi:hypothetical protein
LKINVFFELLQFNSPYTNSKATRICENNGTKANIKFAIKVYMIIAPYRVLLIFFAVGSFSFGCLILLQEYAVENSEIVSLDTSLWQVLVTVCTIGYGNAPIPPVSLLGRIFCIFTCVWGITLYTMFIMSL